MPSMPSFVGNERIRMVQQLLDHFDEVHQERQARVVCIAGGMGWGKTRLVQEFFKRLAAERQHDLPYWPSAIRGDEGSGALLQDRRRTYPRSFEVPNGAIIPWMWWGVPCRTGEDGRQIPAIKIEADQFETHLGSIAERIQRRENLTREGLAMLGSLVGLWLPDAVGLLGSVRSLLGSMGRHLVAGYEDHMARHARRRVSVGSLADSELVDETVAALKAVCGPDLPLVVIVDDAHRADPTTVEFVERVAELPAPILLVALAWPEELRRQARVAEEGPGRTFGAWLASSKHEPQVDRWDLAPMPDQALREMVLSFAPDTADEVVAALCERSDRNPLVLQLMCTNRFVRNAIVDGAIELRPEDIANMPDDLWGHFKERLDEFSDGVRETIILAADHGERFLRGPLVAAAGETIPTRADAAFARAVADAAWFRHELQTLFGFSERVLFEVAGSRLWELDRDLERARMAACRSIRALRNRADWPDLHHDVRWAALDLHVRLARTGAEDDLMAAADSADRLAELERRDFDLDRASELAELALRWCRDAGVDDLRIELAYELTLARARVAEGRVSEAARIRRDVLSRASALFEADDDLVLRAKQDVARTLASRSLDEQRRALQLRQEVLAILSERHGERAKETTEAKQELAMSLSGLGDDRALNVREQVVRDLEPAVDYDPDYLRALTNLAYSYSKAGMAEDALEIRRRVLDIRESFFGPSHPVLAGSLVNLAATLRSAPDDLPQDQQRDRVDEAVELARRAWRIRTEALGDGHHRTWIAASSLSAAFHASWALSSRLEGEEVRADDLDEAHELITWVVEQRREHLRAGHKRTIEAQDRLAEILTAKGLLEEALAAAEVAVDDAVRTLPSGHWLRKKAEERLDALRTQGEPG